MSLGPFRTWIAASAGCDVILGRMSSVVGMDGVMEEGRQRAADELGKTRRGRVGGCVDIRLEEEDQ